MMKKSFDIFKTNGFTLIELMIVVAIIGILTVIALPSYEYLREKADLADAKTALTEINQLIAHEKLNTALTKDEVSKTANDFSATIKEKYNLTAQCSIDDRGADDCRTYYLLALPNSSTSREKSLLMNSNGAVYLCPDQKSTKDLTGNSCEENGK